VCCTTAHHAPRATMLEFGGYDVANAYKTINQVNLNASDDNRGRRMGGRRENDPLNFGGPLSSAGIDHSTPKPLYRFTNRGETPGKDVKTQPTRLHPVEINRPGHVGSLSNADIEGSKSKPKDIIPNPRGTNPLDPQYKLQSFTPEPAYEPKFVRDNISNTDIAGSQVKAKRVQSATRDIISVSDIEGTTTTWRPHHRQNFGKGEARTAPLDITDINNRRKPLVSENPYGLETASIKGAAPKPLVVVRNGDLKDFSIRTDDMDGSRPSRKRDNDPFKFARRPGHYRDICQTGDIEGARSKEGERPEVGRKARSAVRKETYSSLPTDYDRAQAFTASGVGASLAEKGTTVRDLAVSLRKQDREESGRLSKAELTAALSSNKVDISSAQAGALLDSFDIDKSGYMNYKEFVKHAFRFQKGIVTPAPEPVKTEAEVAAEALATAAADAKAEKLQAKPGKPPPPPPPIQRAVSRSGGKRVFAGKESEARVAMTTTTVGGKQVAWKPSNDRKMVPSAKPVLGISTQELTSLRRSTTPGGDASGGGRGGFMGAGVAMPGFGSPAVGIEVQMLTESFSRPISAPPAAGVVQSRRQMKERNDDIAAVRNLM